QAVASAALIAAAIGLILAMNVSTLTRDGRPFLIYLGIVAGLGAAFVTLTWPARAIVGLPFLIYIRLSDLRWFDSLPVSINQLAVALFSIALIRTRVRQ